MSTKSKFFLPFTLNLFLDVVNPTESITVQLPACYGHCLSSPVPLHILYLLSLLSLSVLLSPLGKALLNPGQCDFKGTDTVFEPDDKMTWVKLSWLLHSVCHLLRAGAAKTALDSGMGSESKSPGNETGILLPVQSYEVREKILVKHCSTRYLPEPY